MIKPLGILIIFLFVVTVGGILVWQFWSGGETPSPAPTPPTGDEVTTTTNATAGWQIYTNDAYNFEINYPQDLEVKMGDKACVYTDFFGPCVVAIERPQTEWDNPNITEGVDIYVGESEQNLQYCLKKYKLATSDMMDTEINGVVFKKQRGELDASMGGKRTIGDIYTTIFDNKCYALTSKFYYVSIEFAAGAGALGDDRNTATPEEIKKEEAMINNALDEFDKIIETVSLKNSED